MLLLCLCGIGSCQVYTINKTHLEKKLATGKPGPGSTVNAFNAIHKKQFKNNIDTLVCYDESGASLTRKFNHDSKVRIITKKNKAIKYYVKTLYIYKDEYLIGERTKPKLYGPNYFPVKLADISRIETAY